jgi:hypothetical protein
MLRVLSIAESEATRAACWYDDQSLGLGDDFLTEYANRLQQIEETPKRFSFYEAIESAYEIRRAVLSRFPYAVIYQLLGSETVVLAVMHLSRHPNYSISRVVE